MGEPRFSIIIPTIGRQSLLATIQSLQGQLQEGDEVLIVGDGPQPLAREMIGNAGSKYQYMETVSTSRWGDPQRAVGMAVASGDYLAFMDDDDVYLPDALNSMRKAVKENASDFILFRILYYGRVIWEMKKVIAGNVSSQMVLVRNRKERLGLWAPDPTSKDKRGGDLNFILSTLRLMYPTQAIFREEIIAELRSHSYGRGDA